MPAETYPITGIPVNKGQPLPLRQEITAWASNPSNAYQVSLFLQALTRFKEKPVEEKIGYFQVSGEYRHAKEHLNARLIEQRNPLFPSSTMG